LCDASSRWASIGLVPRFCSICSKRILWLEQTKLLIYKTKTRFCSICSNVPKIGYQPRGRGAVRKRHFGQSLTTPHLHLLFPLIPYSPLFVEHALFRPSTTIYIYNNNNIFFFFSTKSTTCKTTPPLDHIQF